MGSKYTKRYSDEYKRDAIELVRSSGRTVTEVARELGISSESLRGWVKKARAAQVSGSAPGAVRAAGTYPPFAAITPWIEPGTLPSARPISLSDCPSRHRRHTSRFCSSDNPGRPTLATRQHLQQPFYLGCCTDPLIPPCESCEKAARSGFPIGPANFPALCPTVCHTTSGSAFPSHPRDVRFVVVPPVPAEQHEILDRLLHRAERLKILQVLSSGHDYLEPFLGVLPSRTRVATANGVHGEPTAELAVTLLLAAER
ncbi:transposase, partial [Streptomyces sp. NPDC088354]|uniref:transposase n=1 Tax=Streptomyces sp. NPDC088354 TaxID=3365856 RepID=UPI00380E464F